MVEGVRIGLRGSSVDCALRTGAAELRAVEPRRGWLRYPVSAAFVPFIPFRKRCSIRKSSQSPRCRGSDVLVANPQFRFHFRSSDIIEALTKGSVIS